jgi:hypothetical protein
MARQSTPTVKTGDLVLVYDVLRSNDDDASGERGLFVVEELDGDRVYVRSVERDRLHQRSAVRRSAVHALFSASYVKEVFLQ